MPIPLAGGSNITVSSRFRSAPNTAPSVAPGGLNLGSPPGTGGKIVKYEPQLQPKANPPLPAYEPPRFADPPPKPQAIHLLKEPSLKPQALPDLASLKKPAPPTAQATPPITPKNAPVLAVPNKAGILQIVPPRGGVTNALVTIAAEVLIHDAKELYKLYKLSQPESKPIPLPPAGGQSQGVGYLVKVEYDQNEPNPPGIAEVNLWGVIEGVKGVYTPNGTQNVLVLCRGRCEAPILESPAWIQVANVGNNNGIPEVNPRFISISRLDGQTDTSPAPLTPPQRSPTPLRQASPQAADSPGGLPQFLDPPEPKRKLDLVPNLAPPPADKPMESNKKIPITITTPGANPITISAPGQSPITISPSGSPATIKITRPAAIPTTAPSSTPSSTPGSTPAPVPIAVSSPGSTPTTFTMPSSSPITITTPGQQPITFDPSTGKPTGVQSDPNQKPSAYVSTPDPTTTPTNPLTNPAPKDIAGVGLALVGITQLLQGLAPKVSPTAIASAVCETAKPDGCISNAIDKGVKKGNDDLLNKLGVAGQGVDLALLGVMNNKLGNQLTGGLSGGMGRMSTFLGIDRALNILTFLSTVHNASMLTGSLKITLLETLSSIGNATGLLQSSEGDNVDLNKLFNNGIEAFVVSLIGAEAFASMKLTWRKHSTIFRAANNVLSNVSNMFSSIGNGIEVIGERTGKIGNAIRAAGVVRENAYNYMAENMTVHTNKFMSYQTTVGGVTEVLETINEIAESTIEGQQSYTEAVKATTEFQKVLNESNKNSAKKDVENAAIKKEAEDIKANLVKDPTGEDETGLLSFLTDL